MIARDGTTKYPINLDLDMLRGREKLYDFREDEDAKAYELRQKGTIVFNNQVCLLLQYKGAQFNLGIYDQGVWAGNRPQLSLWAKNGCLALGTWNAQSGTNLSEEQYKDIILVLDTYLEGKMRCSKCGDWIPLPTGYVRMYFAGAYCEKCWEGGMKQQEARETYE